MGDNSTVQKMCDISIDNSMKKSYVVPTKTTSVLIFLVAVCHQSCSRIPEVTSSQANR